MFVLGDYVLGTIFVVVAAYCSIRARKRHLRRKASRA